MTKAMKTKVETFNMAYCTWPTLYSFIVSKDAEIVSTTPNGLVTVKYLVESKDEEAKPEKEAKTV